MDEYLNREAIMKFPIRKDHCDKEHANEHFINGIESVLEYVENLPAADVAPVRHGLWLHTEEPLGWKDVDCMECSACHDSWIIEEDYCFDDMPLWNYCPSCGAKMDGGED